jgi:hypothetical protein
MEARPWTSPLAPAMRAPDAFLHLRLRVTDAWLAEDGEWRRIDAEPSAWLWSILGYLRWHAPVLARHDPAAVGYPGVDGYLASRPLVVAIDAVLAARGEISPGDALVHLRALGVAPWELPAASRRARPRG